MVTKKAAPATVKKPVKPAPVAVPDEKVSYAIGDTVVFLGYSPDADTPEDERFLEEGEFYFVADVNDEDGAVGIEIPNPDFNPKKKVSEENTETILIDVFYDEIRLAEEGEVEGSEVDAEKEIDAEEAADTATEEVVEEAPRRGRPAATKAAVADKPATKPATKPAVATEKEIDAEEAAKSTAKTAATPVAKAAKAGKAVAKVKAPAAPVVEEDKYPDLENEDQEMLSLIDESASLLELAQELCSEGASLDYRIGGVLYHVRKTKAYQELDDKYKENKGFDAYIRDTLNIEYRKAMYLIEIYYKFNKFGIDATKVQELGWTKCARIASVMTEENAEELLELAETNTVAAINDNIKVNYSKRASGDGDGTPARKKVIFKFGLWQDQATGVQEVLAATQSRYGLKTLDDAFERIVMEWAAEHAPKQAASATRRAGNATRPKAAAARA